MCNYDDIDRVQSIHELKEQQFGDKARSFIPTW
jgi:hypothetical protein